MPNKIALGTLNNLEITAKPLAFVSFVVVWLVLGAIAYFVLQLSLVEAWVGGFLGALLHYLSELIHHLGHARAARRTGYPMRGIKFVHVLAYSVYPQDEPALSGKIHVRRALGGPTLSFFAALVGLVLVLALQASGGMWYWLAVWFFLDNLLVFFLGAFLPLGFTDGSTLLKWWGQP